MLRIVIYNLHGNNMAIKLEVTDHALSTKQKYDKYFFKHQSVFT